MAQAAGSSATQVTPVIQSNTRLESRSSGAAAISETSLKELKAQSLQEHLERLRSSPRNSGQKLGFNMRDFKVILKPEMNRA